MRILYFLAHPLAIGGASKQMLNHAGIMKSRGHDVYVIVQCRADGSYTSEFDRICDEYELDHKALEYSIATCIEEIDILKALHDTNRIEKVITGYRPDIIHSLQLNTAVGLVAIKLKIPHVMSVYPICSGMFNIKWINVFALYHCADSMLYCRQWSQGLGIRSECVRVAYESGFEPPTCHDAASPRGYRIINIAHISINKNQLEILKLVRLCRDKGINVSVVFLGDAVGDYADDCKDYVRKNHLENVRFEGFVGDVEPYLHDADVMIHSSRTESFPGAIVEAMANKVPVITTPSGGITEVMKNGYNGFVTKGFDAEDLFDSFREYIDCRSSGLLNGLKERAYRTYLENDTYEAIGEQLEKYYTDMQRETSDSHYYAEIKGKFKTAYDILNVSSYSEYTRCHLYYLYHLREVCRNYKSVFIWGTGQSGYIGDEWAQILDLDIRGYIDTNKTGTHREYAIYDPDAPEAMKADCVIVSVTNLLFIREIMDKLEQLGRVRNRDYFLIRNDPCL